MDLAEKLKTSIEALRQKFFTLEEYPFIERDRLPADILEKSLKTGPEEVSEFSEGLSSHQIEALLLDYRGLTNTKEKEKIIDIFTARFSKRLLRLIMAIYQYDYNKPAMALLFKAITSEAERRQDYPDTGLFIWEFGIIKEDYAEVNDFIEANGRELDQFFAKFHLKSESPLADEIKYHYLQNASKEAIFSNLRYFMQIIEKRSPAEIFNPVANYLEVFTLEEYLDGINLAIFEKLGDPNVSPEWASYKTKVRDAFAQWKFLYLLKLRSRKYPNKLKVLSQYYSRVRSSYEIEDGRIVVLDFGEIVVVDILDKPYSLFYQKNDFDREMAAWKNPDSEKEPAFIKLDKIVSARDYMIEEIEDSCMQLSYEGVDTLYIQELLDIKMGLEPDMRAGRVKKSRKKSSI